MLLGLATGALVLVSSELAQAKPSKETTACIDAFERAQEHRQVHKLVAAKADLEVCAASTCPAAIARQCKPWLAEVQAALPTVIVRARDASGADISSATLIVDDLPATTLPREPWPLDPGTHRFRVRVPDGDEASTTIVLAENEKRREIILTIAPKPPPPVAPSPSVPPPLPRRRGLGKGPIALFATSAVGLGVFATFGTLARSERNELRTQCSPTCSDAQVGRVRVKAITADVALGVSAVALALGLYLALSREPAPASAATGPRLRPSFDVAPDRAGASVALTF